MCPLIFGPETITATQFEALIDAAVLTLIQQGNVRVDDRLNNSLLVEEPGPENKAPLLRVDYDYRHNITLIVQRDLETGNTNQIRFDRNFIVNRWQEFQQQERIFHIKEWINRPGPNGHRLLHDYCQPFRNPLGDRYVGRRIVNYPSGAKHFIMNYDDHGRLDGPYEEWAAGGYRKQYLQFAEGRRHGRCVKYHPHIERIHIETYYNQGKKEGVEMEVDVDGNIVRMTQYVNGRTATEIGVEPNRYTIRQATYLDGRIRTPVWQPEIDLARPTNQAQE
jgi:hypothetical protein